MAGPYNNDDGVDVEWVSDDVFEVVNIDANTSLVLVVRRRFQGHDSIHRLIFGAEL